VFLGRNIRSLNQTSRLLNRFSSTETTTTTTTTETIEGAPVLPRTDQFNQVLATPEEEETVLPRTGQFNQVLAAPEEDVSSPAREAYWSDVKRRKEILSHLWVARNCVLTIQFARRQIQ
jgi:hypothetical protein